MLVFSGAALGFSLWQTPVYEASTKLLVGQKLENNDVQQVNLAGSVEGLQQLTQTIVEAINSRPVAEEVIQQLGLQIGTGELLENLSVEQIGSTQFIQLSYKDTDPKRAQQIANTVSEVASERISGQSTGASGITATVWEDAEVPDTPVSPNPVRNGILALGLGLMLGLGFALLTEYLDDTWRSPEEVEQVTGVPTLGVVPKFTTLRSEKMRSKLR
jgi:capsular polysaccharide biosynthesis protein